MKTMLSLLICLWMSVQLWGQIAPNKYFIAFTDKNSSPYSVSRPGEFLTQRAVGRREKQGIAIVENDIPVNQHYVDAIKKFNVGILTRSKWFNGVTVLCPDPAIIDSILLLPFVKRIEKDVFFNNVTNYISNNKFISEEVSHEPFMQDVIPQVTVNNVNQAFNYGASFRQIHMLRGDSLHKMGYRGEGMVIAILDAGFYHADNLRAFDSLITNNQILGTKDFVYPGNNVYNEYEHGMEVLSCMGANLPGELIGTAPKASYWLLRSEDYYSENLIEEYNWVAAAEFADSAGADIINSSLGYTHFDNVAVSHTCNDMDGNTTPVTKGANMACGKGMIVVNSAGNYGGSAWKCLSAPADGYGALAVAAVDSNGIRASFSSTGEAAHRIKPNVAAMGQAVVVSSTIGTITHSSGTSFSCPIIAGLAACLWQAAPGWSNNSILRAIELSGSQVLHPDSLKGYGIPDFVKALKVVSVRENDKQPSVLICPNPFTDVFSMAIYSTTEQSLDFLLYDQIGRCVVSFTQQVRAGDNKIEAGNFSRLQNGNYILKISGRNFSVNTKVVKLNPER